MVDLLKRPEAGESATDVVDYIIGDTLTKISNRVDDPSKLANLRYFRYPYKPTGLLCNYS